MKKVTIILMIILIMSSVISCKPQDISSSSQEPYIVKTYEATPEDELESADDFVFTTYYEMSDGTWKTDEYTYKYRLVINGTLRNAVKDTTYVILSNRNDITFEQAWKASGLSSSISDYFHPEEAKIVEMK